MLAALMLGTMAGAGIEAEGGVTLTLAATSGEDLSHLMIGQDFSVNIIGNGTTAGEMITRFTSFSQATTTPAVQGTGGYLASTAMNDLSTDPILATITFRAVAAGSGQVGGHLSFDTNLPASYSLDTSTLDVTVLPAAVATPEPATLVSGGFGLLAGLGVLARRRRQAATSISS